MLDNNNNLHHILDQSEIEEWAEKLGEGGRIKVRSSKPKDEFRDSKRDINPRRREKVNNQKESIPITQTPPKPKEATTVSPKKPLPFLEEIKQLTNLQEKRDKIQAELKEIEAKHAQLLVVRKEAEQQIHSLLESFNPKTPQATRKLGSIQSQLIIAEEERAEEIREGMKKLAEIANKAGQPQVGVAVENYLKTAEGFRIVWQGLSLEQREERALVARVSPDNAKAFYRAAIAYQKEKEAIMFFEMIPPQWREIIEGKAPTPEVEEVES